MNINPVLKRELLSFQRGLKMPVLILVYNGLMILLLAGIYFSTVGAMGSGGIELGLMKGLYYFLTFSQLILLILMVPAVTAGSISGERQRGTLEILLVSAKSPWVILLGKLQAGLYSFMVLLISSLPLYAIVGLYGGVGLLEVLGNLLLLVILALFYGSVGLCCSAWFKKHQTSMVMSYVIVFLNILLTLVITFIGFGLYNVFFHEDIGQWGSFLLYLNPFVVLLTHLDVQMNSSDNLLALFEGYAPIRSLGIMAVVHLALSSALLWGAKAGLKKS